MNTSANYRAALLTMSKVTAAFADAMETCSGYVDGFLAPGSVSGGVILTKHHKVERPFI